METTTENRTLLGFDFGLKRIGVAVGQSVTMTATPLAILNARIGIPSWEEVTKLIAKWQPYALVVGVPVNMDGTVQEITELARHFVRQLHERCSLPVYEMDERLTTKAAREEIYAAGGYKALQKEAIDSVAAQLILEGWMRENLR